MRTISITLITLFMVLLAYIASAGTDCRVIEYPDRYEAVCEGDAKYAPPPQTDDTKQVIVTNGERRPPPSVMAAARANRQRLIMDQRKQDAALNSAASGPSEK